MVVSPGSVSPPLLLEPPSPKPPLSAAGTQPSDGVRGRAQPRVGQLEYGICEMEKMAAVKRPARMEKLRKQTGGPLVRRWRGGLKEEAMSHRCG